MLKKKERLTRALFGRSFSIGKRVHTSHLQIIVAESDTFHGSVVVGKKVYKKAVDRNRVRRQLYAVLYQFSRNKTIPKTYILIAKPSIKDATRNDFATALVEGLEKTVKL